MARSPLTNLSRRERQIMDAIYRRGCATAADVLADISDPPSYSAIRALLRVLEDKGYLRHAEEGIRYVYYPRVSHQRASRSALKGVVDTFFGGSTEQVVAALLEMRDVEMSDEGLRRLSELIEKARREGR